MSAPCASRLRRQASPEGQPKPAAALPSLASLPRRSPQVKSVREAAATHPTLRSIVETDIAAGALRTQGSRARNLWRVLNALRFLRQLLILIKPQDSSLRLAATEAYNETMAATHVWVIRQAVWLALYWSPTREHFFQSLSKHGGGVPVEEVADSMARYIVASETCIRRLDAIYPGPCVDEHGA